MKLKILVIDDELGRLDYKRKEFETRWQLAIENSQIALEYSYSGAQYISNHRAVNDVNTAISSITGHQDSLALVLLDMQFDYGPLLEDEPTLADANFGEQIHAAIEARFPNLPVLQFTSHSQSDLENQSRPYLSKLDGTVDDLLMKLVEMGNLPLATKAALLKIPENTVVRSELSLRVYLQVYRFAKAKTPLLIRGETGVGKERLARYFHLIASPPNSPFVALQISGIPETLYESELFGYEKGAYTGASKAALGAFSRASNGTIFLDEIGALPLDLQTKLLRVLGERTFKTLGGESDLFAKCSIVAATQDDLEMNGFRKDLIGRFATVTLPSLAQRPEELEPLIDFLLDDRQNAFEKKGIVISDAALLALRSHYFEDNTRGLARAIQNAVLTLSSNSVIQPQHLGLASVEVNSVASTLTSPLEVRAKTNHAVDDISTLVDLLQQFVPPQTPQSLKGTLFTYNQASQTVKRKLAFAALHACRHPVTGKLKILPAMQLLLNDPKLTAMNAKRLLNDLLNRKQSEPIDIDEINNLIALEQITFAEANQVH
jgi:DNA-binding NtrC family response regulator